MKQITQADQTQPPPHALFQQELFPAEEIPPSCFACVDTGFTYKERKKGSFITAKPCTCKTGQELNWKSERKHGLQFPLFVQSVKIPNLYIDIITKEDFDIRVKNWISAYLNGGKQNNALFLTGGTGTGKTAASCGAVAILIKVRGPETDCLQVDCKEVLDAWNLSESRKQNNTYTQEAKFNNRSSINSFKFLMDRIESCELLVLDELGQEKIGKKEESLIFDIINKRIRSNKPSIFVSNHAFDKEKSLKKASIDRFLGERIHSRLQACQHFHFGGVDHRELRKLSEDEIAGYMQPSQIIYEEDPNHRTMPTFMTRAPIFVKMDTRSRSELTYINEIGEKEDRDREKVTIVEGLWHKDSILKLYGPVCDQSDKILYTQLLKMLADQHKKGVYGLKLRTSLSDVMLLSDMNPKSGESRNSQRRRLSRLNRMNISYRDGTGNRWSGPLISKIIETSEGDMEIHFHEEMIYFYKKNFYMNFNIDLTQNLKGDESSLYFFIKGQLGKEKIKMIPLKSKEALLSMYRIMDIEFVETKKRNLRIKTAILGLITKGLILPESNIKRGKVELFIGSID